MLFGLAEHPLQVRNHGLQLPGPVGPVVRAVVREVEHTVGATCGDVVVLEGAVGLDGQAFEEGGGQVATAQLVGLSVTAVDLEAGVVGDERRDLQHRIVALHALFGSSVGPHMSLALKPPASPMEMLIRNGHQPSEGLEEARHRSGVDEPVRVVGREDQRGRAGHRQNRLRRCRWLRRRDWPASHAGSSLVRKVSPL